MFDPDTMRRRFHELGAKRDAMLSVSAPLRERRDALIAEHTAAVKEIEAQIKKAEAGLFDLDMERGMISRALNGRTGSV